jgi:hypothetical protein
MKQVTVFLEKSSFPMGDSLQEEMIEKKIKGAFDVIKVVPV